MEAYPYGDGGMMKRKHLVVVTFAAVLFALAIGTSALQKRAQAEGSGARAPRFEVDPMWPKPLPNHWVIGSVIGVTVDAGDHIWIIHREGALEPKEQYATIDVDYKGNVWIGGNGRGAQAAPLPSNESAMSAVGPVHDSMVLKFTQSGKFLMQIGKPNQSRGSNDIANLRLPAKTMVDPKTNELYVADGYGNRRVIVFDADTGAYKRHWGAYGHKPDDTPQPPYNPADPPAQQFRTPVHCVVLANDGQLYVCDRVNDRIQVFKTDGTYLKEKFIAKNTIGDGAVFDIALSKDPEQKYIYVADGSNMKVHILQRDTLEELTSFGDGGRQPGEFYAVHSIASDSKGNVFTTETYRGQRVQKFLFRGISPVTKKDQGVVWPRASH